MSNQKSAGTAAHLQNTAAFRELAKDLGSDGAAIATSALTNLSPDDLDAHRRVAKSFETPGVVPSTPHGIEHASINSDGSLSITSTTVDGETAWTRVNLPS